MQAASATNENISPKAMKAIMLEIRDLTKTPIDGVRVVLNEECVTDVQAEIDGPGASGGPRPQPKLAAVGHGPSRCPQPACCLLLAACCLLHTCRCQPSQQMLGSSGSAYPYMLDFGHLAQRAPRTRVASSA